MAIAGNVSREFGQLLVEAGAPEGWEQHFTQIEDVLGYCEAIELPFADSKGDFWVLGTTPRGTTVFIEYWKGYYYEHWLLSNGKHISMVDFICSE